MTDVDWYDIYAENEHDAALQARRKAADWYIGRLYKSQKRANSEVFKVAFVEVLGKENADI